MFRKVVSMLRDRNLKISKLPDSSAASVKILAAEELFLSYFSKGDLLRAAINYVCFVQIVVSLHLCSINYRTIMLRIGDRDLQLDFCYVLSKQGKPKF